jgi:hypothetical protein
VEPGRGRSGHRHPLRQITGPITILDGPSPGIWLLDKVATALTVFIDRPEGKTGWRTDNLSTFTVREASPPDSGYEIVEWKQLEGN